MTAKHVTVPCRLCTNTLLPSTARKTGNLCLSCFHRERGRLEDEARESRPGCAGCDGSTESSAFWFDWQLAKQGKYRFRKYPKYLRPVRRVKGGDRYVCTECGAPWYLPGAPQPQHMMLIPPACVAQFEAWCEREITCTTSVLEAARAIGATPPSYDDHADDVRIPCKVTTRKGEQIELAVLRFSRLPPIPWMDERPQHLPHFRLADEIASVEPSRFALSRQVRSAFIADRRGAIDRDWLSVDVVSRTGRRYRLNGSPLFFDRDGVPGEALRPAFRSGGLAVPAKPHGPETVFAADWFGGAKLLNFSRDPVTGFLSWLRWRLGGNLSGNKP